MERAEWPPSSIGGVVHSIGVDWLGIPFQSCSKDCWGAAGTDAMLAAHALYTITRILRRVRREREKIPAATASPFRDTFAFLALGQIISNFGWSLLGTMYWLQPGGQRGVAFEIFWRLSAQCQVALFYFAYRIGLTYNRMGDFSPFMAKHELHFSRAGLVHALAFGIVCLSPATCQQHEYVLWGGINIMFPLLSQWAVSTRLTIARGLHKHGWRQPGSLLPHPLLVGALSGFFFWIGNTGIILGRHVGLARWLRDALGALAGGGQPLWEEAWEEMATFHLFGLIGNDMLWRSYEWVALSEVRAEAASARLAVDCMAHVGLGRDTPRSPILTAASSNDSDSDREASSSSGDEVETLVVVAGQALRHRKPNALGSYMSSSSA